MHYLGSPAAGRDRSFFAYGGAGFVLSRRLMKRLVGDTTQLSLSALYEEYLGMQLMTAVVMLPLDTLS